jgi:hypothetical protein
VLCPVSRPITLLDCVILKDNNRGPCSEVKARNQFPSQSLCTTSTMPQCQMLFFHPALHLPSYILPRDPQERLTSNTLLNRTIPQELVGDYISSLSGMSRDPIWPHSVAGRDIIQRPLALSYQKRRSRNWLGAAGLDLIWSLPPCFAGIGNCTVRINGRHSNLQAAPTNTTVLCPAMNSAYCRYVIWIGSILTHIRTHMMEMKMVDLSHLTRQSVWRDFIV